MPELNKNIYERIKHETAQLLDKTAIVYKGESLTYSELFRQVDELSSVLKGYCSTQNALIALRCYDSAECIVMSLALLSSGAALVPVPPAMPAVEAEQLCSDVGCRHIISASEEHGKNIGHVNCCGVTMSVNQLNAQEPSARLKELNPAFVRFTSGTTSDSKGVIISHKAVIERTAAANQSLRIDSNDTVLWVLSMAYHFVVTILLFLRRGATMVVCHEPVLLSMGELLKKHDITFLYATPYHYRIMCESPAFEPDSVNNVRCAISTAMSLDGGLADAFKDKFSLSLRQAYGIIEVGLPCVGDSSSEFHDGLVGQPLPGYQIKLLDQDADGNGRIHIKGPGMFCGYIKPDRAFDEVCPGGWFDTGDIGRFDDTGSLTIVGRAKSVINFAGMKIFPYEVENVIRQFPSVEDALVYGRKHREYGEVPVAEVVLKPGCDPDNSVAELKKFCYSRLSAYKTPKNFNIVKAMNKTMSGKNRIRTAEK